MSWVNLHLYKDFYTFGLWPCQQTVSFNFAIPMQAFILFSQVTSCYGLFSNNPIMSPVSTGKYVTLPFYPGYKYVAYASENIEEVWILKIYLMSNSYVKVGTFTIYTERPDKLIYYDRSFHVMDIKVLLLLYLLKITANSILFSCVSVMK